MKVAFQIYLKTSILWLFVIWNKIGAVITLVLERSADHFRLWTRLKKVEGEFKNLKRVIPTASEWEG